VFREMLEKEGDLLLRRQFGRGLPGEGNRWRRRLGRRGGGGGRRRALPASRRLGGKRGGGAEESQCKKARFHGKKRGFTPLAMATFFPFPPGECNPHLAPSRP